MAHATAYPVSTKRCAIYTRKSTERGLDMNVSSLDAQRDVCQHYIKSQAYRNWEELPASYDDGGYSGGSLERPALRRLIGDIEDGQIDIIVIYKIDRLTRSLLDFVRLIEVLEKHQVSFVSVTQTFDTSDSMGRLILNILLTFAQFERELMSDRVRDKKAAMRRKGYYTGGLPPFGYLVDSGGRLCIDEERAPLVRELFARFLQGASVRLLVNDLAERGWRTRQYVSKARRQRGGRAITSAIIRTVLANPIYTGHLVHRGEWIEAEIDPLIARETFDAAQQARQERAPKQNHDRDFLVGILHDELGRRMRIQNDGPGRTNPRRYYLSEASGWARKSEHKRVLVRADAAQEAVFAALVCLLRDRRVLKTAILSRGSYSDEIAKLIRKGALAARRLECMDQGQFRRALLLLTPRIEVTNAELKIYVDSDELLRFLAWDGAGTFLKNPTIRPHELQRIYLHCSSICLIRGHPRHSLPIEPRAERTVEEPQFLSLITQAHDLRALVFQDRQKSLQDFASEHRMSQNRLIRLLRVNYLAPDIQTSLFDGSHPPGLTQFRILNAAMLLDWNQQRAVLGLRPPS